MSDPIIRLLTFVDLNEAFTLSSIAGWNQRLDDWRMLLQIAPAGAFAALIDGRIVGTAIGIDYGGFGWIAMMLVDPAFRGRGIGGCLLEAAMDALPADRPIRLDATPLGRPLYQKYGFEDEARLNRHVAQRGDGDVGSPSTVAAGGESVRPLAAADVEAVIERDPAVFAGMRRDVLDWAFRAAPQYAHVVRTAEGLTHYCLGREGRCFDQIGPVVAGDEAVAQALVDAALSAAGDRPVAVDAFDSNAGFTASLGRRGFSIERPLFRMCRPQSGRSSTDLVRETALVEYAILGPEFA